MIEGGRGDDVVLGGAGNDTISDFNSMEEDLLIGGAGDDLIESDGRGDTVYGYSGNDTLNGYALSSLQNDDPGAVLDGGVGNDDLMGDLNSTMTGGAGQDDFTVVSEFGTVDTPAVITDFNPAENDRIFLTITPEAFGDPRDGPDYEVTRQVAADGSGVEILVNGDVYVKLEGITTLEGWIVEYPRKLHLIARRRVMTPACPIRDASHDTVQGNEKAKRCSRFLPPSS